MDIEETPTSRPHIGIPYEEFPGKWANAAAVSRTPHEFTLDLIRIGPSGQSGLVVSRVSFSPLLLGELLDLLQKQWDEYLGSSEMPSADPQARTGSTPFTSRERMDGPVADG